MRQPSRGATWALVTWGSVLATGAGLSLPQMYPGREGGHEYLEHSPDVSRRLAIEVGFVEAASFFNKSKYIYIFFNLLPLRHGA